ncbi:MAG: hypothetical protein HQL28_00230 [Candidatus Omnitrophica bacterium]|nr:hypothetical protein [Candidatus Omnitrophota bacterium]
MRLRLKLKNMSTVLISSALISIVILLTLAGYDFYVQIKSDIFTSKYENSLYRMLAEIYRDKLEISSISIDAEQGTLDRKYPPVLELKIKNNTRKVLTSLGLEFVCATKDGVVVFKDVFYPLDSSMVPESPFYAGTRRESKRVDLGDSLEIRHVLAKLPRNILAKISGVKGFAKKGEKDYRPEIKITGMNVL